MLVDLLYLACKIKVLMLLLFPSSPSSQPSLNSNIRYCKNYCDTNVLANLFKECDCVVHLAGLAHRKACGDFEYELQVYRDANLSPIRSIAKAASMALVKRVVFVSSIGVNGTYTQGNPFTESDCPSPKEPYSIVKLEAERALSMELSGKITDWVVLRPPLVYGPGCPGNLQNLLKIVHRFPYLPFGSLQNRRTFISIENLLDALIVSLSHLSVSRRIFVVADSQDISVSDIIRSILLGFGRNQKLVFPFPVCIISFLLRLLGKQALWEKFSSELRVDSSSFQEVTGWRPSVCPQYGIRKVASHFLMSR